MGIKFIGSKVPGSIPKSEDLGERELGINLPDGKLYTADENGNIILLGSGNDGEGGGGVGDYTVVIDTGKSSYDVNLDKSLRANYFEFTLTQNAVLQNALNTSKGQSGHIIVRQDNIGNWDINFGEEYQFAIGSPDILKTPNAINVFKYSVIDIGNIFVEFVSAYTTPNNILVQDGFILSPNGFDVFSQTL